MSELQEEIIEEEITINDIFTKFKEFNIVIDILCEEDTCYKLNPFNNKYVLILTSLFDDTCDLISFSNKEIILNKCLEYYDDLDENGFSDGSIKITINKEYAYLKKFMLEL